LREIENKNIKNETEKNNKPFVFLNYSVNNLFQCIYDYLNLKKNHFPTLSWYLMLQKNNN